MNDLARRLNSLSPEKRKLMELSLKNKSLHTIENGFASIPSVPERDYYPTSSAQKRIFILEQMKQTGNSYHIPAIFTIEGPLDRNRFQSVLNQLIQRHESFRTSFELRDGEPVQRIRREVDLPILEFQVESWNNNGLTDLNGDTDPNESLANFRERSQIQKIIGEFMQPFDLSQVPLLRVGLVKLPFEKHLLLLDMSHIIADGTSMGILIQNFIRLYQGEDLPELRIQYKDYAVWQNRINDVQTSPLPKESVPGEQTDMQLKSKAFKAQETYWLNQFSDRIPILNLPLDHPRPPVQSFVGERIHFAPEPELIVRLNELTTRTGTTHFMILLAAFNILLSKYSGQEDIIIGTPISGRSHFDLQNLIGMFVNTLALRNYPSGAQKIRDFLQQVKETSLKAYENQDYPFEELVGRLNLDRNLNRNPLFDVMIVLQNTGVNLRAHSAHEIQNYQNNSKQIPADDPGQSSTNHRGSADLQFIPYPFDPKTSKFDLTLEAAEIDSEYQGYQFSFEYCTTLFKHETIKRMAGHYIRILTTIAANPELRLSEICLLSPEEQKQLLAFTHGSANNCSRAEHEKDKTIHELFEAQVRQSPDQIAVNFETNQLTYAQVNGRANQLARHLRAKGIKPNQIIAMMVERSLEMVVGLLGILKAGGAFLPIDPEYPEERIRFLLEDSNTDILVTQGHIPPKFKFSGAIVDLENEALYQGNSANLEPVNHPHDLLYLIYTSGTTGRPKGVMLEHRNLANLIHFQFGGTNIDFKGKVLQFTTISFDVCYQEVFSTLLAGGQLYLISETLKRDVVKLLQFIRDNQIPVIFWPTSFLKFVVNEPEYLKILPECIQHLITAGEQLIITEPFRNYLLSNRIHLHNHYGPSETHVVTTHTMKPTDEIPDIPPIGKPISNVWIYILDPYGNLAPLGIGGELFISGANTGRGYLNRPELTAEKFVKAMNNEQLIINNGQIMSSAGYSLFNTNYSLLYKTGDLARWLPDGCLEFLGRIDHQVKIRGFRVELGEIEAQLLKYEAMKAAIVIPKQDSKNNQYLCAYFSGDRELTVRELREFLEKTMPEYMIPSYFIQLERLPLTPNGKIDRKALTDSNKWPEPDGMIRTGGEYVAPRNEMERKLAHIWKEVLGVERVGIDDNFFELGGHSLKAVEISDRVKKENFILSLNEIFKYRTIRRIVENIGAGGVADETNNLDLPENHADSGTLLAYNLQKNVTSYLFRALPLGIVYAHEQMLPWLYQHFIQVCAQTGDDGHLALDYGETIDVHRDIIGHVKLGYDALAEITDIVSYLVEKINLKQYVIICMDEYYLSEKMHYQKKHFVHESMVYGYNSSTKQFIGCGFDQEMILDRLIFSYDEVFQAFEAGKTHFKETAGYAKYQAVQLLSVIEREAAIEFDLGVFCTELNNYLQSIGEKGRDCIVVPLKDRSDGIPRDRIKHGLNVYTDVFHALEKMLRGKLIIDYRSFHLIAEHKKGLHERLVYAATKYPGGEEQGRLIEEYRQVIDLTENVRLKIFELMHAGPDLRGDYVKIIKLIIQDLKLARQKEEELLSKILEQFNRLIQIQG